MPESLRSSEEIPEPEHLETLTTADILEQFKNNPEAQKQVFGKKLTSKEFEKRFSKGVSAKDIGEITKAIGLKMASLEDLGISIPEASGVVEGKEPGQALAEKLMKEINTLQAGRKLETLSMDELEKIRDKYVEVKEALDLEEEAAGTSLVLQAKNEKGEPVEFNFELIKSKVVDFYKKNDLKELANAVETAIISLTKEQQEAIVEMVEKEGFDSAWIFSDTTPEQLTQIKQATEQEMPDLPASEQYSKEGTYLYDDVKKAFPDKIVHPARPKIYIKLYKSNPEVDPKTLGHSYEDTQKDFTARNIVMDTLPEYLVLQRVMTEENQARGMEKPHPDTKYVTWLDSTLPSVKKAPGQVLQALWNRDYQQVGVSSDTPDYSDPYIGARSSAIFEIL